MKKFVKPHSNKSDRSGLGQGFNDARGEIPDTEDIPLHNGQNVNNDPQHHLLKTSKGRDLHHEKIH
jgi:hypothetical protein